ncbi:MAG TPA: hypothetical protein VEW08_03145 [Steroidobacteraceae bacterium]|nr:hypothetical protein [Steroidobacteraceae bacterium]
MKTRTTAFLALVFCAFTLGFAPAASAAEEFKGNWTIRSSKQPGQVQFGLIHHRDGGRHHSESDWPVSEFKGLDLATKARHDVKFDIMRDAGRIDCEGYLNNGEGAGTFGFVADAQYPKAMNALGFDGINEEMQFAMALHDVSLDFAKAVKGEKLSGLTTDMLMAFRIHGVTPQFIREIRAAGLTTSDSDKLVAFRIHGVTPEMVREVRKSGLTVSEDELIAFRIHGVTPEFIAKVEKLGYQDVEPDQLVAMRIHGVTPEYIADMKARGLKNLTVDQLVNLRIHGLN